MTANTATRQTVSTNVVTLLDTMIDKALGSKANGYDRKIQALRSDVTALQSAVRQLQAAPSALVEPLRAALAEATATITKSSVDASIKKRSRPQARKTAEKAKATPKGSTGPMAPCLACNATGLWHKAGAVGIKKDGTNGPCFTCKGTGSAPASKVLAWSKRQA